MIKIFTDSTSYIPDDILLEHNITVLPVKLIVDGKEIPETEIYNDQFYKQIRKSNQAPETLPLLPDDIASAFEKEIIDGHTIVITSYSIHYTKLYE